MDTDSTNSSCSTDSSGDTGPIHPVVADVLINLNKNNTNGKRKPPVTIRRENIEGFMQLDGTEISYTDDEHLGQGATSIVYKGFYGEVPCAVKRVKSEFVDVYQNELAIWQGMKEKTEDGNVNIVTLFRWTDWKEPLGTSYYLAMELAVCDLSHRLDELKQWRDDGHPQFDEQKEKLPGFIHGAAKGLLWIHNSRILHRDIKPENILIFETSTGEIAKLGDFGISRKLSSSSTGTNSVGKGTSDWMAPEALEALTNDETFFSTRSVDIFSFGMTAHFTMSLGVHPFNYKSLVGKLIVVNIMNPFIFPPNLPYSQLEANHLFQWMMEKNPVHRPKIDEVLSHPFFWSWQQKKDFLLDVARCLDCKTDTLSLSTRQAVDSRYTFIMNLLRIPSNWQKTLGPTLETLLSRRKNSTGTKKYYGDSVVSLVELIRDKYMHYTDMVDELTTGDLYFGENGSFSEKKFINYFLTLFPQLIICIFSKLAQRKIPLEEVGSFVVLENKYYNHFNVVPPLILYLNLQRCLTETNNLQGLSHKFYM